MIPWAPAADEDMGQRWPVVAQASVVLVTAQLWLLRNSDLDRAGVSHSESSVPKHAPRSTERCSLSPPASESSPR